MTLSLRLRQAPNLKLYINSFSGNMREVLEKFDFANTIDKLEQSDRLLLVTKRFKNIDLHPDANTFQPVSYRLSH